MPCPSSHGPAFEPFSLLRHEQPTGAPLNLREEFPFAVPRTTFVSVPHEWLHPKSVTET